MQAGSGTKGCKSQMGRSQRQRANILCLSVLISWFAPVVVRIQAGIVQRPVYLDPIRAIDAPAILGGRTDRKGACDINPALFPARNQSYFVRHFREILILAEDERYIVSVIEGEAHDVQGDSDVDSFFAADQSGRYASVGQGDQLVLVSQRPCETPNPACSHDG